MRTGIVGGKPLTGAVVALALLLAASEAAAQLTYAAALSLRGQYHSNVFATQGAEASTDFVTELEPSLRLRLIKPRDRLDLNYTLGVQLYNRTVDPLTGDKLYGYANRLLAAYQHQFSQRTVLTLDNRLVQGTENTLVRSALTIDGRLQPGLPLSSTNFVADWIGLGVSHQLTPTWRLSSGLTGRVHRVYDLDPGDLTLPHQYGVSWSGAAGWAYPRGEISMGLDLGWGAWQTVDPEGTDHPLLHQALGSLTAGWTWRPLEVLSTSLAAGLSARLTQAEEAVAGPGSTTVLRGSEFTHGLAPVGRAAMTLEFGPARTLNIGYQHAYSTDVVLGGGVLTGQSDTLFGRLAWRVGPWTMDAGGSYSYVRFSTTDGETVTDGALHWGGVGAGISVALLRGVSSGANYRFDILEPVAGEQETLLEGYDRHLVTLGVTVTWPPPPDQQEGGLLSGSQL